MWKLSVILFLLLPSTIIGQKVRPDALQLAYFGETVTHPGIRIAAVYELSNWEKQKLKKSGEEKIFQKSLSVSPGLGFFYHKNYQTSLFVLPEFSYMRKNQNNHFFSCGVGAGYMRSFIPNVYELNADGDLVKVSAGNNYFISNYFITLGKDFSSKSKLPISAYIKPQCLYALPNTPNGVWYFALELGVSYKLKVKE